MCDNRMYLDSSKVSFLVAVAVSLEQVRQLMISMSSPDRLFRRVSGQERRA